MVYLKTTVHRKKKTLNQFSPFKLHISYSDKKTKTSCIQITADKFKNDIEFCATVGI